MNTAAKLSTWPSRTCARDKDVKKDGDGVSKTNGSLRSRARACEGFYDPAIEDDADAATDYAMKQTSGKTGPCRPQDGGPLQKKSSKRISPNATRPGNAILRFENSPLLPFSLSR